MEKRITNKDNSKYANSFEELKFWKLNQSDIFLRGKTPSNIPDVNSIKNLMNKLMHERDYFAVKKRIKELEITVWRLPAFQATKK